MLKRFFLIFLLNVAGCTFLPAQEKGIASYYANRLHGRRMSDGTRYHRDSLTCAHNGYPLGTMIKVTNVKNNKSVVVKVTDRCGTRRLIDLSYAAAKRLDMIAAGVVMVRVEKYNQPLGIPYKLDARIELPELDFEINDNADDYTPIWMRAEDDDKASHEIKTQNNNTELKVKR